jgi:TolB-like protein
MVNFEQPADDCGVIGGRSVVGAFYCVLRSGAALRALLTAILLVLLNLGIANATAEPAPAKEVRRTVAVGPFFAPDSNENLRKIGSTMPDLLTVELSQQESFHVVEREQVTAIWKELNLSATGLVAPETVARLGHVLACDWLVTGTLVPGSKGTQVWVKVVDVKSGVIVDMEALPVDLRNLEAAVQGIGRFLAKAGTGGQSERFVTLGKFTDLSSDTTREDWSRRLTTLIEQYCRDRRVGLVERGAVAPIFEEFQFERAGLTGATTNRVRLQPAFWIVDGACKWVNDTQLKVTLRLQKIGGKEQVIEMVHNAGPQLESAVLDALQPVLMPTREAATEQLGLSEGKLHNDRGMEGAANNDRFSRLHNFESTDSAASSPQHDKDFQDNRRAVLESFEKALLLNPKNVQAKYMLGYALLGDRDAAQRERAKELLKEVVALNDPTYSTRAASNLEHADRFVQNQIPVEQRRPVADGRSVPGFRPKPNTNGLPDHIIAKIEQEQFEKPYQLDTNNLQLKTDYGWALLRSRNELESARGKKLLTEVAASSDATFSKLAASRLQKFEDEHPKSIEKQVEFLEKNFSKLVPMKFEAPTGSDTKIQILHVKDNLIEYKGHYYCGFQFTAPEWLDGDLQWIYFLAKNESNKDLSINKMFWYVLPKSGKQRGAHQWQRGDIPSLPKLKQQFPFSHTLNLMNTDKERLEAGAPAAIWFEFLDQNVCDIAFAMTIDSKRGAEEFGVLPVR